MSKSSVLKSTTDSYEGDKLLTWSMSISVLPELMNLFSVRLQNDDVQDFDIRWDQALLSASDMPSNVILEGLYKSKLQDSVQLQTVLALYHRETVRNNGQTSYLRLKTSVKLHIDQMMRTPNFRVRNEVVERGWVTKSQNGQKACVERKMGECFQWKALGQCSKGDSCSFSHDELAQGDLCSGQRQNRRSSSPALNFQDWRRGEKCSKTGQEGSSSDKKGAKFRALTKIVKKSSCIFGHPPVCHNYKYETGYIYGKTCLFRHVEADEKPSKQSKKGGAKGAVAILKEFKQLGCVSQDSYLRRSTLREPGMLGSKHAVKFSKGTWHQI